MFSVFLLSYQVFLVCNYCTSPSFLSNNYSVDYELGISLSRVRVGSGKPVKSWNFVLVFSRTGKSWKKASGPGKFNLEICLTQVKNMNCIADSKENYM